MSNKDIQVCSTTSIHEELVDMVAKEMPSDEKLSHVAAFFKVFGDTTRVRILSALSIHELCVCDISVLLDMSQSAISHQLRTLKKARLVKNRREGKVVYYSLDDEHVKEIFSTGLEHISHS